MSFMVVGALVIKLAWWGDLEGGRILERTCIFWATLHRSACPPHGIRPRISGGVNGGPPPPTTPSYSKNNFNRHLKFALRKMDMEAACRYTSKAFRRGASQELLQHGPTIAAIKSSSAWMGSGYGSYIGLEFAKAPNISKIQTAQLIGGSSSAEDIGKPTRKRGEN